MFYRFQPVARYQSAAIVTYLAAAIDAELYSTLIDMCSRAA